MRIDAHQHFWLLENRRGSWPPAELAAIHRDFLPPDLAPVLAAHGVVGTVVVQSLPSIDDTLFMLRQAEATDFILGVVGWVDLKSPNAVRDIALLAGDPKLKGLRPMLQDLEDDNWIDDPLLTPAIEAMISHGLVLDALVLPRHLPALLAFAERFPTLPIVIDHAAKPDIAAGRMAPWQDDIARLARLPNVHCKLSGMVTEARPGWQIAELRPYADHLLAQFGARRLIWGSDWPVLNLAADYGRWIAASEALLAALDEVSLRAVFGANAQKFYRLG
ncbi:MAG: amidohydrolase family protein [Massilia sp.]